MKKIIEDVDINGIGFQKRSRRKMKAYSKNQDGKYQFVGSNGQVKNAKSKKKQVVNANRSLKKAKRQQLKKETSDLLLES